MPTLPSENTSISSRWLVVLVGLLSTAYFFWIYGDVLAHPWHFNDDVVQHYLWLMDVDWADDYYARTSGAIQPLGYKGFLYSLSLFLEPLTISRYGPLLTTFLNIGLATAILKKYYPLAFAIAGGLLVGHVCLTMTMGFLARAFCAPLLLAFGYYLLQENRPKTLGLVLVLAALFYPPTFLILGGIGGLWLLGWVIKNKRFPTVWWPAGLGVLLGLAIILFQSYLISSNPDLGEMMTWKTMRWMPEFSSGGRVDFRAQKDLPSSWYFKYFLDFYIPSGIGPKRLFSQFILVTFLITSAFLYRKTGKLSAWVICWIVSTLILFQLAKELLPMLFLPDRYVTYPWRPLAALLLVFCTGTFVVRWPNKWLAAALGLTLLAYGYYYKTPDRVGMVKAEQSQAFYDAILELPEGILLAGPPSPMSHVPLLTERSVLVTQEGAHALYFEQFYNYVTPRLADQMKAYAAPADSLSLVTDFINKYRIDYLVVQPDALREGNARTFDPHAENFHERTMGRQPDNFALLALPDSLYQDINGIFFLIKASDVLKAERGAAAGAE